MLGMEYREYEKAKAELEEKNLTPGEYEKELEKIVSKLNL